MAWTVMTQKRLGGLRENGDQGCHAVREMCVDFYKAGFFELGL